ncbi:MAG: class I SAM-dependent methyltransferase [Streptosporangiaceae bacterium]
MAQVPSGHRLYQDLAPWWPLISPPQEYAEEAAFAAKTFGLASGPVREVLELGSGGGHNASYLKQRFAMTLVDISTAMLAESRLLNPECDHLVGDMRTVRLDRTFDAVFVHDAVDYMISETDLTQAIATAFVHCRPGGIAVFVPDNLAETFFPGTGYGGTDAPDGRGARYLEWAWDPDPADTWTQTEYAFLLRDPDGSVQVVHEAHRLGLFGRETWLGLLAGRGFEALAVTEESTDDRMPRELFAGRRPVKRDSGLPLAPARPGRRR